MISLNFKKKILIIAGMTQHFPKRLKKKIDAVDTLADIRII